MIKRTYIKVSLRQGESINRENLSGRTCILIKKGCIMVFNSKGQLVFRLDAGDANVFDGCHEFTGTALTDDTEVIIV